MQNNPNFIKHGQTGTSEHTAWLSMQERCRNPKHKSYARYGGRGIRVCDRWLGEDGFVNFLADVGKKPGPKYTLERKENDTGYQPGNVRWATMTEQANNRHNNRLVTWEGKTLNISQWAKLLDVPAHFLFDRLDHGWSVERAFFLPMQPHHPLQLSGRRFGKLVAVRRVENDRFGKAQWECRCDCGNTPTVGSAGLVKGTSRSCGCLRGQRNRERSTHPQTLGRWTSADVQASQDVPLDSSST